MPLQSTFIRCQRCAGLNNDTIDGGNFKTARVVSIRENPAGDNRRSPPIALPLLINQFFTTPPSPSLTKRFRPLLEGKQLANKMYYCERMKFNIEINDSTFPVILSLFFRMAKALQI